MYKEFKALKNSSGHGVSFGAGDLYLELRIDIWDAKVTWDLEPEEVKLLVKELQSWLDYQLSQTDIQQQEDPKGAEHICDHAIELDIRSLERHQKLEREVEQVEDKLADTNYNLTTISDHYASVHRVALDRFDEIRARLDRLEDPNNCAACRSRPEEHHDPLCTLANLAQRIYRLEDYVFCGDDDE